MEMENIVVTPVQIVQTPDVLEGKPRLEGRRISVVHIVGHVVYQHWSFEQMREAFGLRPAEIHAALAYYYDHRKEIDQSIEEEATEWEAVPPYPDAFDFLDRFLSTAEAAERLGISERRVRVLVNEGRLPARKLGHQWIIDPDDLERDAVRKRSPGRPPKA
jgi:excisionase family DNA binding protein